MSRRNLYKTGMSLAVAVLALAYAAQAQEKGGKDKAIDDYNFAAWLYNQGKYPTAVDSYRSFLQSYPEHEKAADARFGLAQSLFYQDKFREAADEYEALRSAAKGFAQMPEALFQLAQCRVALDQFAEAETLFGEVRSRFATHYLADWAAARRGACLISLRKFKEAEEALKEFLDRHAPEGKKPGDSAATREMLQRMDQAGIKAGDAFLSLVERSRFYCGIAQFNQERYADARKALERFLDDYRQSPLRGEAQFRLAQSLYQQKTYGDAAAAYRPVAAGTNEFSETAAFEMGLALYKAARLKEAAEAFADMAARFPQSGKAAQATLYSGTFLFEAGVFAGAAARLQPLADAKQKLADEAGYWIGMCLLKQGRHADAEKRFADTLRDFPKSARAGDLRLGLGDALLAQNKLADAGDAFRQFARESGNAEQAPRALYSACVALHRADKYGDSDELCDDFLSRYGRDALAPQVVFLSGENRFLNKAYGKARDRYRELLERADASKENAARARFRLAWICRDGRQFDAALAELEKMNENDAGRAIVAESRYLKGVCMFESGKFGDAVPALQQYLKEDDHSRYGDDALLKTAAAWSKLGNKDKASDAFERFLKEYPASELAPQARYQLAESLYEARQYDKAVAQYEQVLADKPDGELAPFAAFGIGLCRYDQGRWEDAIRAFGALAEKYPKSELIPQAAYRRGRSLLSLKRLDDALQAFQELLKKSPKHELARAAQVSLGYGLQEQKKWAEAAAAFRKVLEDYPAGNDMPRMYYEQAWSWREAGKESESLAAFRILADKFPADPLAADAFFHLAEAAYAQATAAGAGGDDKARRLAEARGLYEKVLAAPGAQRLGDKACYRIGWTHWLANGYAEAAAEFDKVPEKFAGSDLVPDSLFQAGQAYAKGGKPAVAVERYKKLVGNSKFAGFKYLPEAYVGLGDCLINQSDLDGAIKYLEVVTDKYADQGVAAEAYFLLGKAQFDLKQYDKAMASFNETTQRTRSEVAARAQFYVGQIYQAKEDLKQALVAYLRVQALYPQFAEWVAASTFESGKCHQGLGAKEDARKTFQEVVDKFKGTQWAGMAEERLKGM